jgi:phenylpropionate dioxygenase-like ring-hydroxylating dioxygenase large terminal subunit
MPSYDNAHIDALIEKDRVHRSVYTDPVIFDLEMERIWGKAWIYVGHESQVKKPGDYFATEIANRPVIMVRHTDDSIQVLFNRCAHKGAKLVGDTCGSVKMFRCLYHAWSFSTDGTCIARPKEEGYANTDFDKSHEDANVRKVPRIENYRGFIFASLSETGPDLKTWLGGVATSFDNLIDRSPEGKLELVGGCFRYLHNNNWKMFVENLNDSGHPMVVHHSSAGVAKAVGNQVFGDGPYPFEIQMLNPFVGGEEFFEAMDLHADNYGHCWDGGEESIHAHYSEVSEYDQKMIDAYGEERAKEILSIHRHNSIVFPNFTLKGVITSIRVVKPIAVDKTIIESWVFRQVGVPDDMFQRSITYCNIINSQANLVGPDDAEAYERMQHGLASEGGDWVSQHRYLGEGTDSGKGYIDATGTSDQSFRNIFSAWKSYMTGGDGDYSMSDFV